MNRTKNDRREPQDYETVNVRKDAYAELCANNAALASNRRHIEAEVEYHKRKVSVLAQSLLDAEEFRKKLHVEKAVLVAEVAEWRNKYDELLMSQLTKEQA